MFDACEVPAKDVTAMAILAVVTATAFFIYFFSCLVAV